MKKDPIFKTFIPMVIITALIGALAGITKNSLILALFFLNFATVGYLLFQWYKNMKR
jgi:hypothetical protein